MSKKEKQPKEVKEKYKQSETVFIKRSQIKFAPYNPKRHDKESVLQIKKNIKNVAFLGGIIWNKITSNLVDGHKRIMAMDAINGYDGTKEKDYDVKVEMCSLDEKTEKEQNVFQIQSRTELDLSLVSEFINEIDFESAGLTQSDIQMIQFENPNFEFITPHSTIESVEGMNTDFKDVREKEKEEKKGTEEDRQARIDAVKEVKKNQTAPSNYIKHIIVTFKTIEDKVFFLENLGIDSQLEFVPSDKLEERLLKD